MTMSQMNVPMKLTRADGGQVEDPVLREPLYHFLSAPGRNLFRYDDIEDGSDLRRGLPTAHNVYGVPFTLNCVNYAQSIILEHVLSLENPKVVAAIYVVVNELRELARSVGKDIHNRDTFRCPTELQYRQDYVAEALFAFNVPVQILQLHSEDKRDLRKLVHLIALFSLITTDYLNLKSEELAKRKSYCQDLSEGKFNFPIVHAINSNHEDSDKVAAILMQRTKDEDLKRYCVSLMEKIGSFAYTRQVLEKLRVEIREEIEALGGNPLSDTFMDDVVAIGNDL